MEAALAPYNRLAKESRNLFWAGRLEEAERKCRQAIAAYPLPKTGSSIMRHLADIQLAQGKFTEALENYGINRPESMRHIPGYPELCMRISQCYLGLGNIPLAKKFYTYATSHRTLPQGWPSPSSPRLMEASLLMLRGSEVGGWSEQALRYYQAAGKLAPQNMMIAETIGDTLYRLKRYDEAIPYYRRVLASQGEKASYRTRTRVEMYDRKHGRPHPPRRF